MTTSSAVTTSNCNFNVLDALSGRIKVMLIHAVNGGLLRPDSLNPDHHWGEPRTHTELDEATRKANGHLWYLTPGIFIRSLQRMTYYIESAASHEPGDDDPDTSARRRITVATTNLTANGVWVGCVDKIGGAYQFDKEDPRYGHNQLWIVTPTCCDGLTFVPILDLSLIWGTLGHSTAPGVCPRPVENWGGDPQGSHISIYYPRPERQHRVPEG